MNRPHIFIIDDDTVQHLILKKRLQSLAPELCISHFDNGKAVIEYFNTENITSRYILFLDLNMPQPNGWELLDYFARKNSSAWPIDIIIMSSSQTQADRCLALSYKMVNTYLLKPITEKIVIASLNEINQSYGMDTIKRNTEPAS